MKKKTLSSSSLAKRIVQTLRDRKSQVVTAESCTAGAIAACIGEVPGASEVWCGGWIVYLESSKSDWLGISPRLIQKETAVSPSVTEAMARSALQKAKAARFALGITGYLGPTGASVGRVYVSIASRPTLRGRIRVRTRRFNFDPAPRLQLRKKAVRSALQLLISALRSER